MNGNFNVYRSVTKGFYEVTDFGAENRDFDRTRKGLSTNLGVEWYINETASLTTSIQFRDQNNEQETTNSTIFNDIKMIFYRLINFKYRLIFFEITNFNGFRNS